LFFIIGKKAIEVFKFFRRILHPAILNGDKYKGIPANNIFITFVSVKIYLIKNTVKVFRHEAELKGTMCKSWTVAQL